uniref:Uncharacterized protein n=1 Tax=Anguilla anguilla TaxID=7936 RepID=A0A0E9S4X7_ANGAN
MIIYIVQAKGPWVNSCSPPEIQTWESSLPLSVQHHCHPSAQDPQGFCERFFFFLLCWVFVFRWGGVVVPLVQDSECC